MIYTKGIKKGDTIGIVAPSGPFRATTLGEIENALNDLGYNVKFGESCYGSYKGYLSSEDSIRAKDIEDMKKKAELEAKEHIAELAIMAAEKIIEKGDTYDEGSSK